MTLIITNFEKEGKFVRTLINGVIDETKTGKFDKQLFKRDLESIFVKAFLEKPEKCLTFDDTRIGALSAGPENRTNEVFIVFELDEISALLTEAAQEIILSHS